MRWGSPCAARAVRAALHHSPQVPSTTWEMPKSAPIVMAVSACGAAAVGCGGGVGADAGAGTRGGGCTAQDLPTCNQRSAAPAPPSAHQVLAPAVHAHHPLEGGAVADGERAVQVAGALRGRGGAEGGSGCGGTALVGCGGGERSAVALQSSLLSGPDSRGPSGGGRWRQGGGGGSGQRAGGRRGAGVSPEGQQAPPRLRPLALAATPPAHHPQQRLTPRPAPNTPLGSVSVVSSW